MHISVENKGGKKYQGGQKEYCLTDLLPSDVITIELDSQGTVSDQSYTIRYSISYKLLEFTKTVNKEAEAEAGIEIRALKGPWNQNSSQKDKFSAILTPQKVNIGTIGPCTTRNQCWRTKIGYDVITQKFIDLEN